MPNQYEKPQQSRRRRRAKKRDTLLSSTIRVVLFNWKRNLERRESFTYSTNVFITQKVIIIRAAATPFWSCSCDLQLMQKGRRKYTQCRYGRSAEPSRSIVYGPRVQFRLLRALLYGGKERKKENFFSLSPYLGSRSQLCRLRLWGDRSEGKWKKWSAHLLLPSIGGLDRAGRVPSAHTHMQLAHMGARHK